MSNRQNGDQVGADAPERPLLRIVSGDPSVEELAVLLAVVAAYAAPAADAKEAKVPSAWSAPAGTLRGPLLVGPGRWVTSGWQAGVRTRSDW